jgi:hypothetical protein
LLRRTSVWAPAIGILAIILLAVPTAVRAIEANADRHAANVLPTIIREVQRAGAKTLRAIAEALNARARGGRWQAMTVSNVLARA